MSETNRFGSFRDEHNPYAAPAEQYSGGEFGNDAVEAIRRQYLSHEASIQSIGLLYILGSLIGTIAGVALLGMLFTAPNAAPDGIAFVWALFILVMGVAQGFVGNGLRKLQRWTRIPVGILSGIGLIGIPIGTIINGYILYLIFSAKGSMVYSDAYQRVIQQTPHIKYKTSIIVWIFLFLLLGLIGMGVLFALLGG